MSVARGLLAVGLLLGLTATVPAASVLSGSRRHHRLVGGTVVAVHHDRSRSAGTVTIRPRQRYHRHGSRRAIAALGRNNRRCSTKTFRVNRHTRFERTPGGRTTFAAVRRGENVLIAPGGRSGAARVVDILQNRRQYHHQYHRTRRAARRAFFQSRPRWYHAYRRPARRTVPATTVKPAGKTTGTRPPTTVTLVPPKRPAPHKHSPGKPSVTTTRTNVTANLEREKRERHERERRERERRARANQHNKPAAHKPPQHKPAAHKPPQHKSAPRPNHSHPKPPAHRKK